MMRWLVLALCLLSTPSFAWMPHGGGVLNGGGGALTEIGSGVTLINNGSTASSTPVRFGYGFARGDMPLGNTIVCKDESGTTYPCQVDELSTRTGMPHATDNPGWLHSTISLIYTPSWTAGAMHTFHIYQQSGAYTPGTGLAASVLTGAHHYQVLYNNVKNFAGSAVGSGNFTCDLNNAIAAGARVGVGSGVSGGGGGYTITENGQVETTIEALAPAIDNTAGTPQGQVMCQFFVMMWQTSPGSGTLGNVELSAWIGLPWQNTGGSTTIGFMWGDASLFDAATSTTLRNFSSQSTYAPSDFFPDPQSWASNSNAATSAAIYSAQCGNVTCNGNGWGNGGNGYLTASSTTVTNANGAFFPTSNLSGNIYLYVGPNTGCTSGAYQITGTVMNGATLASAPCGSSGTIQDWQLLSGFINNNGNLQTGTVIQWSVTGGGTLPAGISASRPYFVAELATSPTNAPGPFTIANDATVNQWPDNNGFASQGSCPSGSCIVATRKVGLQPWEGTWLFADDLGHPFWIGGNANGAVLYPALTTAQITYFESTALVPPFCLCGPAVAQSPFPLPGNTSFAASGPYYESLSNGPQETNIDGGGPHMSLGNMGGLEGNAVMNMTQANWDLVHVHALTMASAFGHTVLNTATGWYTPYDCGPYPNGNLSSCGTYGSPIGAAGTHVTDFLLWANPANSTLWSNFTTPATLTGFLAAASPNQFDSGIFWAGGTDGSNSSMSHEPDYGNALAYIIGGEPWYLRGVQGWATFAAISQWDQGDSVKSDRFTINGYTYTRSVLITNTGETPRGNAWSFRALMYAAVLGADNDPGRALFWNYAIESVDEAYGVIHQFYGLNINSCTGCSADPNIETLGIISPLAYNSDGFMVSYYAGVTAQFYGLTHYTSNVLSGSSALWLANEAGTLSKNTWYNVPITNGASGYPVCNYWAAAETYAQRTNQYGGTPETPGTEPAASNAGGIYIAGDGSVGWRSAHMDASGIVTPGTYNQTNQGLVENGDTILPEYVGLFNSALGSSPYWTINVVSNSSTASFQLTTTPPSTQACSATTGSTGCPAAISPPSGVPFSIDLAWRPQACSPSSSTSPADGGGVDGYSAEDWAQFEMGINYGLTLPNLSNALSNLTARWNRPAFSSGTFVGNWQSWYMGPVTVPNPPPPTQTIASITASPSPGSCATGATNTCTTVSASMSPASPGFTTSGGSFSLVASGGACSGGDTTDFSIGSTSGVIAISNTSVSTGSKTVCVDAQTSASNVTNSPQYQPVSITVTSATSQTIASIAASPSPGSCATGATGVTCTTVSATMSPTPPTFSTDGGTFSLVASGGSCSGGDTTDFAINASTGVITLNNASATVGTDTVCVKAQTTASNVTNSPQYQSVSITVTASGSIALKNHGVCTAFESNAQVTSGTCAVTVNATGDGVIFAPATCNGPSCGGGPIPQITALTYSGGSCADVSNTHTTATTTTGVDIWFCQNISASGSVTLSFTASGGGGSGGLEYPILFWSDWSGIVASNAPELGNNGSGTATANAPFTLGLGNGTSPTSQANELVYAACIINPSNAQTFTAQQTQLDAGSSNAGAALNEYTIPSAAGASPMGCTTTGTGGRDYSISVAAFKHP